MNSDDDKIDKLLVKIINVYLNLNEELYEMSKEKRILERKIKSLKNSFDNARYYELNFLSENEKDFLSNFDLQLNIDNLLEEQGY